MINKTTAMGLEWPANFISIAIDKLVTAPTDAQKRAAEYVVSLIPSANGLTERDRDLILMKYRDRITNDQIAARFGVNRSWTSNRNGPIGIFLRDPIFQKWLSDGLDEIPKIRKDLYAYGIDMHVVSKLRWYHLTDIDQLLRTTRSQVEAISGIGIKKADGIQAALAAHGLALPETPPDGYLDDYELAIRSNLARIKEYPWMLGPEHKRAIRHVLGTLSDEERYVVRQKYAYGLSLSQIVTKANLDMPDRKTTFSQVQAAFSRASVAFKSDDVRKLIVQGKKD